MMPERARKLNAVPARAGADYVLYWSQMNRRVDSNQALEFAAALANENGLPLLVYEGLTCSYPYASDRLHTFILEGVEATQRRLAARGIGYVFYLRRRRTDPNDTLYRLAARAMAVVTDDYPTFIAARHNARVPEKIGVPYYAVDASCIVPMSRIPARQYAAYAMRPKIRKLLPQYLRPLPPVPVRRAYRGGVSEFHTRDRNVRECEIDHSVKPALGITGGREAAEARLRDFLEHGLRRYARERNEPGAQATSGLSPYLHFGQISSLEVALAVGEYAAGHKLIADEFLEELIVRRELAFNFARYTGRYDTLTALPEWAQETLRRHARDRREAVYSREEFEHASTHDPLWNATQKELLLRGVIHGYYRMYWGKKIIEWSRTPGDALATMIYLHDRYALDGRDPNTYTNILWCFGLHDRPWAERPVFGKIRYMSYDGMRRKTDVDAYLRRIESLK